MNRFIYPLLIVTIAFGAAATAVCKTANDYSKSGLSKESKHDWDGAIADYTKAINLQPDDDDGYSSRARVEFSKVQHVHNERAETTENAAVIADYTKAIEILEAKKKAAGPRDPNDFDLGLSNAYFFRALANVWKRDWDAVIADCSKVLSITPNHGDAYAFRAIARRSKGDTEGALEDCTKASGPTARKLCSTSPEK